MRLLLALTMLAAGPAFAQQRAIVVPADAAVVIPPRSAGAALPAAEPVRRARTRFASNAEGFGGGGDLGLGGWSLLAVPLAAAAGVLAGGGLPGGGGHGTASGPVRTR